MASNIANGKKQQNIDTPTDKIENFKPCIVEIADENSKNLQPNIDEIQKETIESASFHPLKANLVKNSINYTDDFNKLDENLQKQISDTSKNILDPLSEIDSQHNMQSKDFEASKDDEILVFSKLFPNVSIEKLEQDELFRLFSSHNGKNLTISDLYTNYLRLVNALSDDFAKKSLVSLQNKLSSPGSLASSEKTSEVFFTKEQVLKMTPEQISQYYNIIRKSQQKW
ncbi:MAG: hypothetical protein J6A90_04905 [Clostridia bacterium]|nr:hypothetical protein [Clostridia bacterium]